MSGGLNDDFALDDDIEEKQPQVNPIVDEKDFAEAVFDDPIPGEMPVLKEDIDVVVTSGNKVDDLLYFRQDVLGAKGMNKQLAMEAQSIIPDFLGENRSLGFFTETVTKTQYAATLESIDSAQKSALQRMIDAVKSFFVKIMEYINKFKTRLVSSYFGVTGHFQVFGDIYKPDMNGAVSKVQDIVKNPQSELESLKSKVKNNFSEIDAEKFFEQLEKRFERTQRSISSLYNTINNNPVYKAVVFEPAILKNCFAVSDKDNRMLYAFEAVLNMIEQSLRNNQGNGMGMLKSAKHVDDIISKLVVPGSDILPSVAYQMLRNQLDNLEDKKLDIQTNKITDVISSFRTLFTEQDARKVAEKYLSNSDMYVHLQNQYVSVIEKVRDAAESSEEDSQVRFAMRMLSKAFAELTSYWQLRVQFTYIANAYVVVGDGLDRVLKMHQKDVFVAASTLDEKFQDFIKNHFSNGHSEFFDRDFK